MTDDPMAFGSPGFAAVGNEFGNAGGGTGGRFAAGLGCSGIIPVLAAWTNLLSAASDIGRVRSITKIPGDRRASLSESEFGTQQRQLQ